MLLQERREFSVFYSVEAWLYQNLPVARRICEGLGSPPALVEQLARWERDRGSLDEVRKPKDTCQLGAAYNAELATKAWPAAEVCAVGKSFAATVEAMLESGELAVVLGRTATVVPEAAEAAE